MNCVFRSSYLAKLIHNIIIIILIYLFSVGIFPSFYLSKIQANSD